MGCFSRCFCDPFKLTYISAIFTAVEGGLFAVLNIVLICMYTCAITPPWKLALDFDKFYAFYFYNRNNCDAKGVVSPNWTHQADHYPLTEYRSLTTSEDNFVYQIIYLCLHVGWVITAIILIYGNARKRWGYYLPWLLVTTTIVVMDVTVSAFIIQDMVTINSNKYTTAMFWNLALYFRLFIIFFMNLSQYGSACNAFRKARHKRTKQERQRRKMADAQAEEIVRVEAAAEARVRAQIAEQQAAQEVQMRKIPPPVPKKPAAPSELRPFSYLNPAYRPNDPTDVEGMRANPNRAPDIPMKPLQPLHYNSLGDAYLPNDGYTRARHLEGLPRRSDSVRTFRTQERHPALRRFSSTRGHPSSPVSSPYVPMPDYDMTMKPPPSANNQSEYKRQGCWMFRSDGTSPSLSPPVTHAAATEEKNPHNPIPTSTHFSPHTYTSTSYSHHTASRRASHLDIIPPQTPSGPSPILYTQTSGRTHLQIYTSSSDADDDSLSFQEAQGDKFIFGGVFVPVHCRKLTLHIANSFHKVEGSEREEFPERFWNAQWRSMRAERASASKRQCSEIANDPLPHISPKREINRTTISDKAEKKDHTWKNMTQGKDLAFIPTRGSTMLLNQGDDMSRTRFTKINKNTHSNNNLNHDTVDSSRTLRNEAFFTYRPEASNRRTVPARRFPKHSRRKLSETYIDVSLKRESHSSVSNCSPWPLSVASEDLLPSDPAFPIINRAVRLHAP